MRYWWVNQKQTYRQEIGGGYLWSPKRRSNQSRNQFYENMKEVAPGDLVFSYWRSAIRAYGQIRSFGYDAPKPEEFGSAGRNWSQIGYRADVDYVRLDTPIAPRDAWERIRRLLPEKYSPLNPANGLGLQSVYLAALPLPLGQLLWKLVESAGNPLPIQDPRGVLIASVEERERDNWERHQLGELESAPLPITERDALVKARRGQGEFRRRVAVVEQACRLTKVTNPVYLIASHIKPWRHASNEERLSENNGLMLAPQADFLFDRGFISFEDDRLLISPVAEEKSLIKLGIDPDRPPQVGRFNPEQERFLEFHRAEIFRRASTG
ncbi:MAG TPA: HNH endonuclease [Polyangiaceae bacterium]|nr:HNH endonuclease [Polyangiaceae bacterium]